MKLPTILILLVIVLAIGFGFLLGFPGLQFIGFNPETQHLQNAGMEGMGIYAGLGGTTTGFGDELLNDDEYILSWSTDLVGQRVSMWGAVKAVPPTGSCVVDDGQYRVFYEPGHSPAITIRTVIPTISGIVPLATSPGDWEPKGRTEEGILQAELWAHCVGGAWVPLAVDQAKLFSGIGNINRLDDQVTVGETACFSWRIGYITDDETGRGWSVDIYSQAQARDVVLPTKLSTLTGRICYTTTTSDFSSSPGVRNELRATLRNELWDKKFDVVTTIDQTGTGPTLTIDSFEPKDPKQGDTVTVSWTASPNPSTQSPIRSIVVQYGFGGADYEKVLPADAREFAFVVGQAGDVRFVAIAYDEANRPSPTDSVDIRVGEPESDVASDIFWIIFLAIFVVGLIIAVVIGRQNAVVFLIVLIAFTVFAYFAATTFKGGF